MPQGQPGPGADGPRKSRRTQPPPELQRKAAAGQQPPRVGGTGVEAGQQDHKKKALHPETRQQEQHARNAEAGVPHAVPEDGFLFPYPLHGTVHHALEIHQRHGRAEDDKVAARLGAAVEGFGQRLTPHPERRSCQRREIAGEPEHPVDESRQPPALAPEVGLGDLGHQQDGKAPQQSEGKGQ